MVARTFKSGNDPVADDRASELSKTGKREEAIAKYSEALTFYNEGDWPPMPNSLRS